VSDQSPEGRAQTEQQFERLMDSLERKVEAVSGIIKKLEGRRGFSGQVLTSLSRENNFTLFGGNLTRILEDIDFHVPREDDGQHSFFSILERSADAVMEISREGSILWANANAQLISGYDWDDVRGKTLFSLVSPEYQQVLQQRFAPFTVSEVRNAGGDGSNLIAFQGRHKNGSVLSLEAQFEAAYHGDDLVFFIALRDFRSRDELSAQLKQSRDNYDALSETVNEVILRIDESLDIVYCNHAVSKLFGYAIDEVIGKPLTLLFPNEVFRRHEEEIRKAFYVDSEHRQYMGIKNTIETLGQHKNRGVSPMEISFGNTRDFETRTLTCIVRDITTRKNAERRLHLLAYFDNLTSLGNRDLFNREIGEHLEAIRKNFQLGGLLFLDLDGFKKVNDTLGHNAGDELLVETAHRLHDCLRESDSVYRLGGDEFLVLLRKINRNKDAAVVARHILNTIRMPYHIKAGGKSPRPVSVGVSIGINIISHADMNLEELIQQADLAMYAAKAAGKNTFSFYTPEMLNVVNERWELEQGLNRALANNEFEMHYQPIVDCDGRIRGVEALLRWIHPEKGIIQPEKFLKIAEETNLIQPIGVWVLNQACQDAARWAASDRPDLFVSVNFHAKQFDEPDIVDTIENALKRSGCPAANLKVELTETGIMQNPEETIVKMNELKRRLPELEIMVDDFGTGYSSLNYLANLPADTLKIDLSFVSRLDDVNNEKVVTSIINLAESLSMDYIVEGIETVAHRDYFRARKGASMQGFYFCRPMPVLDLEALLIEDSLPVPQSSRAH
jgi:diguanylate cyclase (GGDEF)-like protein/PAS domain S-box-containing protein